MVEYEHIIQKIITSSRSAHGYDLSETLLIKTVSELRLTQLKLRDYNRDLLYSANTKQ